MEKFGIFEFMIVLVILLLPIAAALIGITLSKSAAKKRKHKWNEFHVKHKK